MGSKPGTWPHWILSATAAGPVSFCRPISVGPSGRVESGPASAPEKNKPPAARRRIEDCLAQTQILEGGGTELALAWQRAIHALIYIKWY